MKALVITRPGTIELKDLPTPERAGDCLIRVSRAGICGTDLQILEGYAEFTGVPGHEFVGVVEQAPPADAAWVGKRVVGEINIGCRHCDWCARGIKEHCDNRNVVGIRQHDGAFAEYLTLPAVNLHEVPDSMDDETAVFAEPVAAACRIFEQMTVDPSARVAVVGDGRMGLLVAQVLKTAAPDVTVLGRHDSKLAVARALGLSRRAFRRQPRRPAARFDVVVDVTGRPEGLRRALADRQAARHGDHEVHVPRRSPDQHLARRRRRGDAHRFALRSVSSRARSSGVWRRAGEAAHLAGGEARRLRVRVRRSQTRAEDSVRDVNAERLNPEP